MATTAEADTEGIVDNEFHPEGHEKPGATASQGEETPSIGHGKANGLTVLTALVFLVGEMAGSGVLALPKAVANAGWTGIPLVIVCGLISGYSGVNLGKCWNMLQERYPEYRTHVRHPYPSIAEKAVGRWMRYIISFSMDFTLFGVATVFLLIACQNVQSLLHSAGVEVSFCYWLPVVTAILIPASWLGTPKDMWPIAVGASIATGTACLIAFTNALTDKSKTAPATHSNPGFKSFFLAFGTILFAFGGASTFPTVQHDMKEPTKFPKVVVFSYAALLWMYVPISAAGYFVYGDSVEDNILQSLSGGWMRVTVEILITAHLILAFVIALNPFAQEVEEIFKVPNKFHWKRCIVRTVIVLSILFVAETVPHFGVILSLVGGSTVTFLTFIAPAVFYLRLTSMEGDWPKRSVPLYIKVANMEIILIGILGGVASTYSAVESLVSPGSFTVPCYINITAAAG